MTEDQQQINFNRITEAIEYLNINFKRQPNLDEVAAQLQLSPFHFQRIFAEWAGVSPKKFLQYISVAFAKDMLKDKEASLFDVAYHTGLSGTGRLHDLFVKIEGMTPGEYKNGGENLHINYSYAHCPFGNILVAATGIGICYLAFCIDKEKDLQDLKINFPNAVFTQQADAIQQNAIQLFTRDWSKLNTIKLHLKATPFQLKVWEALLKIPFGELTSYGNIAAGIENSKASRAVGTAIGANPVAFLIPCHRVIQASGVFGGYRWGVNRKSAIIGWEAAKMDTST